MPRKPNMIYGCSGCLYANEPSDICDSCTRSPALSDLWVSGEDENKAYDDYECRRNDKTDSVKNLEFGGI